MTTLQQNLEAFADAIGDTVKDIRVLLNDNQANLSSLSTSAKSNVVEAINELKTRIDTLNNSAPFINDGTTGNSSTWSSSKIHGEIMAALNGVLNGAPSALDTLKEIADAINDDPDFAASIMNQIDRRVRWDTAAQNLNDSEKLNARINIGAMANDTFVYSAPTASSNWTIAHNLGRYPSVTIVDSAGTQFFGTVTYVDINTVTVHFNYATGGKAYLT